MNEIIDVNNFFINEVCSMKSKLQGNGKINVKVNIDKEKLYKFLGDILIDEGTGVTLNELKESDERVYFVIQ